MGGQAPLCRLNLDGFNGDLVGRLAGSVRSHLGDRVCYILAAGHRSEDRVQPLQMGSWSDRNEELAAVGAGSRIGHG